MATPTSTLTWSKRSYEDMLQDTEHPVDIGWQALGPALALSTVALGLVCLRWFTRAFIVQRIGLDDWLITASMICSIGMTIGIAIQFFQRKQVTVRTDDWGGFVIAIAPTVAKLVIVNNALYSTVTNLTKSSIVVQYLRIFSSRGIRFTCYLLLVLLASAGLYGVFAGIFICHPVRRFWNASVDGFCFNANALWLAGAGINIPLDWAVWITPMPVIGKLRLPRKQMVGVCMVFALGGFICVTSITRLAVVHTAANLGEHTRAGIRSVQWSAIEANVGIICASLMAMKPLILRLAPNLLTDSRPSPHAMRIGPVEDDHIADRQFWSGGSVSTTCVGSEGTIDVSAESDDRIKVTTEMEQTVSRRPSSVLAKLSGLWAYKNRQLG